MESTNETNVSEKENPSEDDYQRLKNEHTSLEEKLYKLEELKFPSESEESQIRQLKKQKLSLKEQMEKI
ncbi:MAG: YdcH family protein [Nitrospinaceae bacterium]|jgi:uncharacterized protein YdcH (DUF465 family)|nr:YdcH family protein [Nitrospinaceae bacterium]MBT3432812.1 YdcH family protein [Nitrospinaceae bacterium]MBT3822265.1 YdcH family protein [Nitrospinaceae bacterium]MBT4093879.1 YdcH family protein [Nitrospinaceae bacterium]MBT4432135.1 YdcH family protein [Nitrospinaceae bacterium]